MESAAFIAKDGNLSREFNMPFTLTKKREIRWPVSIAVPIDGGNTETQECSASFEILNQDEYDKLIGDDVKFCVRVVTEFGDDIKGEDGSPLLCNTKTKEELFKSAAYVRMGFINAYHEAATGIFSKNLKGQPGTGQSGRKTRKKK